MLDKIVLSKDRREAWITYDNHKTVTFWHSDGLVMDIVNELIVEPTNLADRCDEDTAVIDLQLSLFTEENAA